MIGALRVKSTQIAREGTDHIMWCGEGEYNMCKVDPPLKVGDKVTFEVAEVNGVKPGNVQRVLFKESVQAGGLLWNLISLAAAQNVERPEPIKVGDKVKSDKNGKISLYVQKIFDDTYMALSHDANSPVASWYLRLIADYYRVN